MKDRAHEPVSGTVVRMTTAPKGELDGAELEDGTVIHWPPHLADRFTAVAKKGDRIEVVGHYKTRKGGEKVFEVHSVTNSATQASFANDENVPHPKKEKDHIVGPARTVEGKVIRLTTAPKGEIDGAELDDGTVIHWPPHLEAYFTAVVKKGERMRAVGEEKEKKHGTVLEVQAITDLATGESRSRDDAPPHHPNGPDHRLRALEEKVDLLAAEVERLGGKV